ncbi:MAG: hypothetical protein Q8M11_09025 [Sulfuritalea sp.]|nr:hypothetical protein [Sulfuritalea sp.]
MSDYQVPPTNWLDVATALIDRLTALLKNIVAKHDAAGRRVYLVETQDRLTPAVPGSTDRSKDRENEIHPTPGGYRKLTALWRPVIEAQVA